MQIYLPTPSRMHLEILQIWLDEDGKIKSPGLRFYLDSSILYSQRMKWTDFAQLDSLTQEIFVTARSTVLLYLVTSLTERSVECYPSRKTAVNGASIVKARFQHTVGTGSIPNHAKLIQFGRAAFRSGGSSRRHHDWLPVFPRRHQDCLQFPPFDA